MSDTLSRFRREREISLETLLWKRASSLIEQRISWFFSSCGGKLGFLSSCNGDLRDPIVLPERSRVSSRVARQDTSRVAAGV